MNVLNLLMSNFIISPAFRFKPKKCNVVLKSIEQYDILGCGVMIFIIDTIAHLRIYYF